MFTPAEIAQNLINIGKSKTTMPVWKMFFLGIMAGAFIAFAAVGCTTAGYAVGGTAGKLVGACVFPAGLAMVVIAGSELFTGNCLLIAPVLAGKLKVSAMLKNWLIVYIGNFVGSLLIAAIVIGAGQLKIMPELANTAVQTATAKASLSFGEAFFRGVACNFLVCIAVWMTFGCKSVGCKVLACFFPIMMFVLCGFEHSIANMYFVPVGLFAQAAGVAQGGEMLTWGNFFINNLIPVTLGNIVGGGVLVGGIYSIVYLNRD